SRSPRLPPTPTDGHYRLAICRGAGCAFGSLEELRRKQPFRHREAANRGAASRAAIGGKEREIIQWPRTEKGRSPATIHRCDAAPNPTGFTEIVGDDFLHPVY